MTIPLELIESDVWPAIRQKIEVKRDEVLQDLIHIATLDGMRRQQGFIEGLDWVVEQARPRVVSPPIEDDE